MATLHQKLAVVIVLASLGGTLWAGYLAYRGRDSTRLRAAGWLVVAVMALQGAAGVLLTTDGDQPSQQWHYLFGPLAFLALPVALLSPRPSGARTAAAIVFAGWLLTFALSLRAVGTGGLAA